MIAIQTKYIPATNSKGSRVKAWTPNKQSVTIPYSYDMTDDYLHFEAVKALVKKYKLDWNLEDMRFGGTKDGYVFCFARSIVAK